MQLRVRRGWRELATTVAFVSAACTGSIAHHETDAPSGSPNKPGGRSGGNTAAGGAGGSGPAADDPDTNPAADAPCGPGVSPLRRLTAREYGRTVVDLVGTRVDWGTKLQTDVTGSGFENNVDLQNMSQQQLQQFVAAAEGIASDAVADLPKLMGCDPVAKGDACVTNFITSFGKRAYRRPLLPGESDVLLRVYRTGSMSGDVKNGVMRLVEAVLLAPQFMYRAEIGGAAAANGDVKLTSWEIATRLSYTFIGSMPDKDLAAAADADRLQSKAEVLAQAKRLLADARAQPLRREFDDQWLGVGRLATVQKDAKLFPSYAGVAGMQRDELSLFIEEAFWKEGGNLRQLFTAPFTFRNAELAKYYGEAYTRPPASNAGTPMTKVDTDPQMRPGLFSQGGFLALMSAVDKTNPVFRGKFVRTNLLCDSIPPPPPTVNQQLPDLPGMVTTRQRFAAHSKDPSCSGCHSMMDPIGVGLESFDATGKYRTTENGLAIDATGELTGTDVDGAFTGPGELGTRLAGSTQVHGCVATSWFRYAQGRSERSVDRCTIADLTKAFEDASLDPRELLLAVTQTDAFYSRTLPQGVAR